MWLIVVAILSGCMSKYTVDTEPQTTATQTTATLFPTTTTQPATVTPLRPPTVTSTPLVTQIPLVQENTFVFWGETIPDGKNLNLTKPSKRHGLLKIVVLVIGIKASNW
jgi:hypothetical protein